MQKQASKFIALIFLSFFSAFPSFAQVSQYRLYTADSLFDAKRYTQALAKFEGVINNGEYTPAMLLKMAYIHEGLGNIAETQYFLQLYFLATNDASVHDKMMELADKNNLRGYQIEDQDRAILFLQNNRQYILMLIGSLLLLSFALMIYQKRSQKRPKVAFICVSIFSVLLVLSNVALAREHTYIIIQPNTYLMSGPSAGSDLVEIVEAGHKIRVKGKKDVWLRALWGDQVVYLREEKLLPIVL